MNDNTDKWIGRTAVMLGLALVMALSFLCGQVSAGLGW